MILSFITTTDRGRLAQVSYRLKDLSSPLFSILWFPYTIFFNFNPFLYFFNNSRIICLDLRNLTKQRSNNHNHLYYEKEF
jgi:hypothetical protein